MGVELPFTYPCRSLVSIFALDAPLRETVALKPEVEVGPVSTVNFKDSEDPGLTMFSAVIPPAVWLEVAAPVLSS